MRKVGDVVWISDESHIDEDGLGENEISIIQCRIIEIQPFIKDMVAYKLDFNGLLRLEHEIFTDKKDLIGNLVEDTRYMKKALEEDILAILDDLEDAKNQAKRVERRLDFLNKIKA